MSVTRSIPSRVFWALTWGAGVAIGVAAGGWLTVVGGAGAPGTESLDLTDDLIVLPLIVGSVVTTVHLVGGLLLSGLRGLRASNPHGDDHES